MTIRANLTPTETPPALIVLGRDEAGRPHASTFAPDETDLATKAAGLMGFSILPVAGSVGPLAAKLPKGRLFASGKGFVPFVKATVFDALVACEGLVTPPAPESSEVPVAPTVEKPKGRKPKKAAETAPFLEPDDPPHRPATWDEVRVGSVVLASEGMSRGWWEVVIQEIRDGDLFVLAWWDWPDDPRIIRRRDQVALTPPTLIESED